MTEQQELAHYRTVRAAYDANPSERTARAVLASAVALYTISDDYTAILDEADDIMAEPA